MGFTAKGKNSSEGWGMGFLLVFFPEDEESIANKKKPNNLFSSSCSSSPSSSSTSFKPINTLLRRTNSAHLLSRAQSTISVCALLIFITLLLFTLSTFEPTTTTHFTPRRHLSSNSKIYKPTHFKPIENPPSWSLNILKPSSKMASSSSSLSSPSPPHALQGMGSLYRRGTKAMNDLIVAHITESVTVPELRLFLRLFHRSALTSRADLLLIFPSKTVSFDSIVQEENESILKLVDRYQELNATIADSAASFDVTQFVKSRNKEKETGEPIWGRRIRSNYSDESETELTRLSYGSVVGFEADELDPENSLAGFLDHVPLSLRRWACYPMLLGRVRRNFKHVMLVDVKEILLLGDPLSRVRNRSPETVYLSTMGPSMSSKHGKKNSGKTQSTHQNSANSAIIMGGTRGIRRLSTAMQTEIVRAAMQHKRKNSATESGLFNQLVGNEFILKNINLIKSAELIPELSSLRGRNSNSGSSLSLSNYTVVRYGNSNPELSSNIVKDICSFPVDSLAYSDC
ncbi:unnamed protein product [Ilex paraguariensis]|uniref:DUF7780 domain-containing protein n=1 Tax=Ilex paraguariensis TaxID=185542 RepID=A0ABC8UMW4_9AQUA